MHHLRHHTTASSSTLAATLHIKPKLEDLDYRPESASKKEVVDAIKAEADEAERASSEAPGTLFSGADEEEEDEDEVKKRLKREIKEEEEELESRRSRMGQRASAPSVEPKQEQPREDVPPPPHSPSIAVASSSTAMRSNSERSVEMQVDEEFERMQQDATHNRDHGGGDDEQEQEQEQLGRDETPAFLSQDVERERQEWAARRAGPAGRAKADDGEREASTVEEEEEEVDELEEEEIAKEVQEDEDSDDERTVIVSKEGRKVKGKGKEKEKRKGKKVIRKKVKLSRGQQEEEKRRKRVEQQSDDFFSDLISLGLEPYEPGDYGRSAKYRVHNALAASTQNLPPDHLVEPVDLRPSRPLPPANLGDPETTSLAIEMRDEKYIEEQEYWANPTREGAVLSWVGLLEKDSTPTKGKHSYTLFSADRLALLELPLSPEARTTLTDARHLLSPDFRKLQLSSPSSFDALLSSTPSERTLESLWGDLLHLEHNEELGRSDEGSEEEGMDVEDLEEVVRVVFGGTEEMLEKTAGKVGGESLSMAGVLRRIYEYNWLWFKQTVELASIGLMYSNLAEPAITSSLGSYIVQSEEQYQQKKRDLKPRLAEEEESAKRNPTKPNEVGERNRELLLHESAAGWKREKQALEELHHRLGGTVDKLGGGKSSTNGSGLSSATLDSLPRRTATPSIRIETWKGEHPKRFHWGTWKR
ncbi:hypothetical protein JCM8547_002365 [Rhodosporidiobolus lusitaniae]